MVNATKWILFVAGWADPRFVNILKDLNDQIIELSHKYRFHKQGIGISMGLKTYY